MWLYYALGKIATKTPTALGSNDLDDTLTSAYANKAYASETATDTAIYRVLAGDDGTSSAGTTTYNIFPRPPAGTTLSNYKEIEAADSITYDIDETNSGDLPSFALEITTEKGNVTYAQDADTLNHFSRVFTGCQVNTLTMNFEEGQDVKATVGAVSRKAHDTPTNYIPKRNQTSPTSLFNYSGRTSDEVNPYMFSDGTIKAFGQTYARIKSGSLTISNNLTPHRFIGNYDRTITSAHIAGQRTYELQLNLLITDRTLWTELRNKNETSSTVASGTSSAGFGLLELEFSKSATDSITLKFDNYLTTSVDMPFPEDKGPLEVAITLNARTLNDCVYVGKWLIQ